MKDSTEDELDSLLDSVLQKHNLSNCENCGRKLDRGDLAWNSASTEAGTPCSHVYLECQECDTEAFSSWSWYPWIDNLQEAIEVLDREAENKS